MGVFLEHYSQPDLTPAKWLKDHILNIRIALHTDPYAKETPTSATCGELRPLWLFAHKA
tara:strand:+ start:281 stop:457 length:177 start_codon:yes stop_codon:yes gene_type:complete